ncbi:MAG: PocR ligand-binding domain-containing protein, partial [Acidobacteriota bacterium]
MKDDNTHEDRSVSLSELADFPSIRQMLLACRDATGMNGGLIDAVDGSIILGDDWPEVCRLFHRKHQASLVHCAHSGWRPDPEDAEEGQVYACGNGLPAIRIPIVVGQQHLATLVLGPFFLQEQPADHASFQARAEQCGYDATAYHEALQRLPVLDTSHVDHMLGYGRALASFIAAAATQQQRLIAELSARKKAEAALREKAAFIEHLLAAIPSPVFFKDRQGIYRECNDAFAAMLRLPKEAILGKSAGDLNPAANARKYHEMDERLYREGGVQRYEWSVADASGLAREYLFTKSVFSSEAQPLGLIGIMTDITDRKQAEKSLAALCLELERRVRDRTRELERVNERLVELDRMKSSFLNTVSHEVRTPMTSILGFVKLVGKDFSRHVVPALDNASSVQKKLARIQENLLIIELEGERLTRLLNDVLDAAKIESGSMRWDDQAFLIKDFLQLAVSTIQGQLPPGLEVVMRDDGTSPWIKADPDRIMQVMMNLLHNAVKFTREGRIAVHLASRSDGQLDITVSDTGIGIPESELAHVFDRFH